ncbi:CHAD domain-containing protein [Streptomyces sp. ODS28]|uniref:CHAD domain-containing protein n=1 Tax=Streptomyces sp. ODS28 TaxID=3136688 RepID=UPI0031EFFDBB
MAHSHDPFADGAELVTAAPAGPAASGAARRRGGAARHPAAPPGTAVPLPASLETATAGEVLGGYLHDRAAEFLRSLRLHGESAGSPESAAEAAEAVRQLRRAARRLNGSLHTYRSLLDGDWADQLRGELGWLSGTLSREYAYAARLERLQCALYRIAGDGGRDQGGGRREGRDQREGREARPAAREPGPARDPRTAREIRAGVRDTREGRDPREGREGRDARSGADPGEPREGRGAREGRRAGREGGALPVGAARAGALLERQLTLARTRAHSAALQALGSSRFHAVVDQVAVLASEAPLSSGAAEQRAAAALAPPAGQARTRLAEAVGALPLSRAEAPYNADALTRSLTSEVQQDAAWLQTRLLLRLHRYAEEVLLSAGHRDLGTGGDAAAGDAGARVTPDIAAAPDPRLAAASAALDRLRDAAEAAAAAAAAARTPRIAPATAYALGVLHADQRHEVEAARFAFGRLWLDSADSPAHGAGHGTE